MLYVTRYELLNLLSSLHNDDIRSILPDESNLFKDEILLYVPIYDGYESEIKDEVGFYSRNAILSLEDKFIIAIDHNTTTHIHLCDHGDEQALVLSVMEDRTSKVVELTIDIIDVPVLDKVSTHFCKLFPTPTPFEDEEGRKSIQDLWDENYNPDIRVFDLSYSSNVLS